MCQALLQIGCVCLPIQGTYCGKLAKLRMAQFRWRWLFRFLCHSVASSGDSNVEPEEEIIWLLTASETHHD
jgi:hypothetical protein